MGASAAAAIIIRRERDLVAHFQSARAIHYESAMTPSALGVEQRLAWDRLVDRAVIREAAPGTYYLDELSWNALRRTRRRLASVLIFLILVVLIPILFIRR